MRRCFLAALLLAAVVVLVASPAAQVGEPGAGTSSGVSTEAALTGAEQRQVEAYWTDARMQQARSLDGARARVTSAIGVASASRTAAPVVQAAAYRGPGPVTRAVGRVFFTLDGQNFSCSGTSVQSRNQSTVITAGHCVNAGPGPFAQNWVFVPGYVDNRRPYGTWTARSLHAPTEWVRSGRTSDDFGYAVVNRSRGRRLAEVAGALPVAFGRPRGGYVWAFGFPVAAPNAGRRLLFCRGRLREDEHGSGSQGLACTMTSGASGGPWLAGFGGRSGAGVVYSVTSFTYRGMGGVVWGPYLGRTASALYAHAQTR